MTTILRRPQVCKLIGLSVSTLYRMEKAGDFPQRLQIGQHSVGWLDSEVTAWIEQRRRGGCAPIVRADGPTEPLPACRPARRAAQTPHTTPRRSQRTASSR